MTKRIYAFQRITNAGRLFPSMKKRRRDYVQVGEYGECVLYAEICRKIRPGLCTPA